MAANDNVTVRIVGDATGVQPAVQEAGGSIAGLEPMLAQLNASMRALTAQMTTGFTAGAASAKKMALGLEEAKVAASGAGAGFGGMVSRIHEGAESIRTFQMRAKEFAEVYVAIFAVDRIAEFIGHMGEAAEKVEHLSQQFGMSTGEVQKLQGVATATGISVEALTKGMGFLDRNLANAQAGSKSLKATMDQVGLSFNDGRSQMEKLAVVADKFKNMDDGPKKVALAMQLFGRSGKELIPILDLGSKGIEQLNQKLDEYGVRNDDAIAKGAALAESVNESKLGFMGIENVLTSALAPVFKVMVDDLNSLIAAFVKSYQEGGIVADIFAAIGGAIQEVAAIVEALGEIFSAIWQVISEVVGDIAQAVFECFGAKVPGYVNYTKIALNEFKDLLTIVKDSVIISLDIIGGAFRVAMQTVVTFGKIAWDALHLNWGGIQADWAAGMAKVDQIVSQEAQRIKQHAAEMAAAIQAAARGEGLPGAKGGGLAMPKAGGDFDFQPSDGGGKKKKKSGMSLAERLEAELEARKTAWAMEQDAQGTFQQYSLQSEADYWAEALRRTDLSAKDKLAIEKKYLAARAALKKDEIDKQLDGYSQEIEAAGANWDAKLAILRQEQAYLERMYGAESREARQAADAVVAAEREKRRQILEIQAEIAKGKEAAALAGVDAEEASAQFAVEMGRRSQAQLIQQDRQFENERFAIRRQALLQNLRLAELDPTTSPQKLRQIYNQIEDLDRQHQAKLTQIERTASAQRTALARNEIGQFSNTFGQAIGKMITLQESWRDGLVEIYQGLVQVVADVVAQIIEKWLVAFLTKLILGKQDAAQSAANYVAQAGAGGVASMAAAPFPINLTAPAFGASMAAAAAGFSSVAAAAGGDWRVREGLYHLHEEEMVLPAWAAAPLRQAISGGAGSSTAPALFGGKDAGGGQSSRGGDLNVHYAPTIHHQDSSLKDSLRRDSRDMRRWFGRQMRNGSIQMPAAVD